MKHGGPVQEVGEILSVGPAGAYIEFRVFAPGVASGFVPGHFVAVGVGGEESALVLRRAFALYGATPADGTIRFVVAEKGAGTRWLCRQTAGMPLDLVGPLGNPFRLPLTPRPVLLVGGGYGTAPLIPLAHRLTDLGCRVVMVIGAASADRLFGEREARRVVGDVIVTTDDGSAGLPGWVTGVLPATIARVGARAIYACGPMAMLQAVGDVARLHGVPAQVAVEEAMACGIGVCMSCVLPVWGADGRSRFVRSCVDGPVFAADRVRWADVGRLPEDLVGADAMKGH